MSTSVLYRCLGIMGGGIPHVRTIFETASRCSKSIWILGGFFLLIRSLKDINPSLAVGQ